MLLIEDFNTVGLSGRLKGAPSEKDHFVKLILRLGSSDKVGGSDTSGGSYGFGKTVYSSKSDCRTVIYYSAFPANERSHGHSARLIVASLFQSHVVHDREFDGRAFFGDIRGEGIDCMAYPLVDEEAHRVAVTLGFERRSGGHYGTSIGILGSQVDMLRLREAVETHWWPKLVDHELAVELIDDGEQVDAPSPKSRRDLKPFLKAYEFVQGRDHPERDQQEKLVSLQPVRETALGRLGLVGLPLSNEPNERLDNTVALIRGPKMVVRYQRSGSDAYYRVAGVFKADDKIDALLRLSEPIEHDHWSMTSARLFDEEARSLVDTVLRRVRDNFGSFQREISPAPPPQPGGLRAIEKLLAGMMPSRGRSLPDGPTPQRDPFEIRSTVARILDDEMKAQLKGQVTLRLKDDAPVDNMKVRISLEANILENESLSKGDPITAEVIGHEGDIESIEASGPAPIVFCSLSKEAFVTLDILSEAVDSDWILQFAERVEAV